MGTPPPTPQILVQMFGFYFHSWVAEVFSTYLKSEFWGLKLSSSRRAQTGVECVTAFTEAAAEENNFRYSFIDVAPASTVQHAMEVLLSLIHI